MQLHCGSAFDTDLKGPYDVILLPSKEEEWRGEERRRGEDERIGGREERRVEENLLISTTDILHHFDIPTNVKLLKRVSQTSFLSLPFYLI